jgi:hypothetical protein
MITNDQVKTELEALVTAGGKFTKDLLEGGAHYIYPENNVYGVNGVYCANCRFFNSDDNTCGIVDGYIFPTGACRFWNILDVKLTPIVYVPSSYVPAQTTEFDMDSMMQMIMMIMMMSIMSSTVSDLGTAF